MSRETVTIEYPEAVYTLFDTSCEGLPAVTVVNAALRKFSHREIFPWHLSVIITPRDLAENGMPTREETLVLDAVGDEIEEAIVGQRNALFLARETWNGRRQLLFRVHDPEVADKFLQSLITRGDQKREWEFRMDHDPSWSFANEMLSLFDKAGLSKAYPMNFDALHWTGIEARGPDGPLVVRHRQFPDGFPKSDFPHRLNIFWQMSEVSENGMPEGAESNRMNTFEDRLVEATEPEEQSVLLMVLTGKGQREYVIQTRSTDEFLRRLTDMPQENEPYPIELHHTDDSTWEYFDRVLGGLIGSGEK